MQNQPREAALRPISPYNSVDVLLLRWEDDDLMVKEEIHKLERVFRDQCHFTTHIWNIPSINPEENLLQRISELKRDKMPDDLLILYYGGHADGNAHQCIWAAKQSLDSPAMNWHNVQYTLLGSEADVLIILDCCFSGLAARDGGTGANWFLGSSAKESVATGVSRSSFTSVLIRQIERFADRYWRFNERFNVQSLHYRINFWDSDLEHSAHLVRLTEFDHPPTELTPLLDIRDRRRLQSVKSDPLSNGATYQIPLRAPSNQPNNPPSTVELPHGETQTLRIRGLPFSTQESNLRDWFEERMGQKAIIAKMGALIDSPRNRGTKEVTVTFANTAIARRAMAISNRDFQAKPGEKPKSIAIDEKFDGLTCVYSSAAMPPTVDVVLVHGACGHPINSFAVHYSEPGNPFLWPCDALAAKLEAASIFPRILAFGWDADAWLDSTKAVPHACDDLVQALKSDSLDPQRPLFFIGHGVGGLLVKQVVNELVNFGFSLEHFENPVKACFFFSVPNHAKLIDDGYARILANMRSALRGGTPPHATLVRGLKGRNRMIAAFTDEFDAIRREHDVECFAFNGTTETGKCLIVPPLQGRLDDDSDNTLNLEVDYRDIVRLPKSTGNLTVVVEKLCALMCKKVGTVPLPGWPGPVPQPVLPPRPIDPKEKEKVLGRLKRYDTSFLVDDSSSMLGKRWDVARDVLAKIAPIAVQYDRDGVDLRFFNEDLDDDERLQLGSAERVMQLFEKVRPEGPTPTADVLEVELSNYVFKYKRNRGTRSLNLIVITDGEPERGQDVGGVIAKYAKRLANEEAPPLQLGIQFVQIGGDEAASKFLKWLDDDLQDQYKLDRDVRLYWAIFDTVLTFVDGRHCSMGAWRRRETV